MRDIARWFVLAGAIGALLAATVWLAPLTALLGRLLSAASRGSIPLSVSSALGRPGVLRAWFLANAAVWFAAWWVLGRLPSQATASDAIVDGGGVPNRSAIAILLAVAAYLAHGVRMMWLEYQLLQFRRTKEVPRRERYAPEHYAPEASELLSRVRAWNRWGTVAWLAIFAVPLLLTLLQR